MLCPTLGTQLVEQQLPAVPQLSWSAPPRWVCRLQLIQTLILTLKSSRPFHGVLSSPLVSPRDHALTSHLLLCQELCPHLCRGSRTMYLAQATLPLRASCSLWRGP